MGGGSVLKPLGDLGKSIVGTVSETATGVNPFEVQQKPKTATAPDQTAPVRAALDAQLQQELQIRRSMALMTGGQGTIGQPQTMSAGQSLLGT